MVFPGFSMVFPGFSHGETSHFSHGMARSQVDDTCIEEAKATLEELSGSTEIWSEEAWKMDVILDHNGSIYGLFFGGVLYIYIYKYWVYISGQFKTTSPTSPRNNDLASEISSSPSEGN